MAFAGHDVLGAAPAGDAIPTRRLGVVQCLIGPADQLGLVAVEGGAGVAGNADTDGDGIKDGVEVGVDGVYTADPEKDATATRYTHLSFSEAISKGLKIMDTTAFTLCQENNVPIIVFDMNKDGNLAALVSGEDVGTLIS